MHKFTDVFMIFSFKLLFCTLR